MLLIQSVSNNYRQRNFTKDWLQDWRKHRSPSTWRAFAFPFVQLWQHAGQMQQSGALRNYALPSVPRLESTSALLEACPSPPVLCAHHTSACQCAHLEGSLHWEKKPGKCIGKALKNYVCNALHLNVTYVACITKAIGPEQSVMTGQKSPNMTWVRINYWIRSLLSMWSHFTIPIPLTKQVH